MFKTGLLSWVYPVEVLQPYLGSQDEQHILAASSSSSSKQQATSSNRRLQSPCEDNVGQNRHPSSSKQPGSKHASPQSGFVTFRAV